MYTPAPNLYATTHRMRVLLSNCARVQTLMEADDADEAMTKVLSYGEEVTSENVPVLAYPAGLVCDQEFHVETGDMGEVMKVPQRTIEIWLAFYVPDVEGIESYSDEKHWVDEQWAAIVGECLTLTGRGEPIAGETFLNISNPVYLGSEREPDDERGDGRLDSHPDRSRWFGAMQWEVH
jgi:hypothetical protein